MKFSVIMCNFNYGNYIGDSIDSVLSQDYKDFELIIVDDGSTDNSRQVISLFHDPRITTILKENGGQSSAFNSGFKVAKGEIVAFIDSDDKWLPKKLSTVLKWHNFLNGSYSILQHAVDVWDGDERNPFKRALPTGDCFSIMKETGQIGFFVPTSGLVMKKSTLEQVFPIPPELKICTDAFLTRTSFTQGMVYSIPDVLALYRKHQNHVLDNEAFDNVAFNEKLLYPALNRYYSEHDIDFQFGLSKYYSQPERLSSLAMFKQLVEVFILRHWASLAGQEVAILGAGEHTAWLEKITFGHPGPKVVAILDHSPDANKYVWGLKPRVLESWSYSKNVSIILSSDTVADKMAEQCYQVFGKDCQTINLYEGLPPGPYPKKAPYYTF
jgi:glycosyltransferase involved in cell wall biosynthesis